MTFEEFFKKKKIDLSALEKADVRLFSEFQNHYEQMGEKSFDHTKKYWFNKLRLQHPLPAEIKTEKFHIANPLAEQTVTESLIEEGLAPKPTTPKVGFTPRFKAPVTAPKPVEENIEVQAPAEQPASTTPKPGFTPRFKAASPPKKAEEQAEEKPAKTTESVKPEEPASENANPPAYKPRFKPGMLPKKSEG